MSNSETTQVADEKPWRICGPDPATVKNPNMGLWSVEGDYYVAGDIAYKDALLIVSAHVSATERDALKSGLSAWLVTLGELQPGEHSAQDLMAALTDHGVRLSAVFEQRDAERDSLRDKVKVLMEVEEQFDVFVGRIVEISEDFIPDRKGDAEAALSEMREALTAAIEALSAKAPHNG